MSSPTGSSTAPELEHPTVPPPPPDWAITRGQLAADLVERTPAGVALLAALVGVGVLFERSVRAAGPGLNVTATLALMALAVVLAARTRGEPPARTSLALVGVAAVFGAAWMWRGTPWLAVPNTVIALAALTASATYACGGSWWRVGVHDLIARPLAWIGNTIAGPRWVTRGMRHSRTGTSTSGDGSGSSIWWERFSGAILALPIVAVLALLLGSADESFARVLDPMSWGTPAWSIVLILAGTWFASTVARTAIAPHPEPTAGTFRGSVPSGNVVLGSMAIVFAVFTATRLATLSTLDQRVITTRGVTWSGEARSGFFQLLAVAGITLLVTLIVRVCCASGARRSLSAQRWLTVANCGLILVIVATAVARLLAYQRQFGWTMLRLATTTTALWLGIVFMILAAATVAGRERSRWLCGSVVASAVLGIGVANVMNPAGFVASANLKRATTDAPTDLDIEYLLGSLGDDGLPALADAMDRLTPDQRDTVLTEVCTRPSTGGWWSYQWSRRQADVAAARICVTPTPR